MPDGVADHPNRKKSDRKKREADLSLETDGSEKPDRDPDQIEGHEKFGRPGNKAEKLRRTNIKAFIGHPPKRPRRKHSRLR